MIHRVVVIRLKPQYREAASLEQIVEHSRELLATIPLIRDLRVAGSADGRTQREWDLTILTTFDSLQDIDTFRTERTHRAYADVYLRPMMETIRVWHFDLG